MSRNLLVSRWILLVILTTIIQLSGCSESVDNLPIRNNVNKSFTSAELAEKHGLAKTPGRNGGLVKTVKMAAGYTYIEVDVSGDIFWLATSITDVTPGDRITWNDFAMMTNFRSKALNREFSQILFVDRVMTESAEVDQSHSGIVIESMNSAGYSYILVEENGTRIWLAAPESRIQIGQSIRWSSGAPMHNFTSRSLDRDFDIIFFVSAFQIS